MTIQELVIGHFEGTLGAAESAELDRLLASSPEAKAAFDRQKAIEETMAEDADALVAPSALREVTLAAALGTAVQTIGGGLGAFFTTKIAATLGGVVAGGLIIGGVVLSNDDDGSGDPASMTPPGVEQTIEPGVQEEPTVVREGETQSASEEGPARTASTASPREAETNASDASGAEISSENTGSGDDSGFGDTNVNLNPDGDGGTVVVDEDKTIINSSRD